MELQQSPLYAKYITALKWQVLEADGVRMFYRRFPLMGGLLKIQRPKKLPRIEKLVKKYRINTVAIEPIQKQNVQEYKNWCNKLATICKVVRSNYMPTKTILVDLTPTEEVIFSRFSEAKRRAVRRAKKNGIRVTESDNISDLINIKNKSGGFLGFITTIGTDKFWRVMSPAHTTVLLGYHEDKLVGGILVIFWNTTAFYWIAGSTREGKKLFAPTLLVWEAIRTAKKHGAKNLDFLGVWDERKPYEHHDWKGFTRFKEGFGGKALYYPVY